MRVVKDGSEQSALTLHYYTLHKLPQIWHRLHVI